MSTKDYIKNIIIRVLCAIMLLVVQSDLLAADTSYLKIPTTAIELIQPEADDTMQSLDTDDYYRQASRTDLSIDMINMVIYVCLPDIYYTPQDNKETLFFENINFKFGYDNINTAFCVFRI